MVVRLASRVLRIRMGEGRVVALVMSLMFVATAAITIGESGIEALFFDRVGAGALPTMYLLQGAFTFAAMLVLTNTLGRLAPRRAHLAAPLGLGSLVLVERFVLVLDAGWTYRLLWITVALGALLQAIFLWGTAGAVVDTRQARRLFPIFGAGGILGSVVGGLATRPLAGAVGAANLLVIWAAGLAGAFLLARLVLGRAPARGHGRRPRRDDHGMHGARSAVAFVRRSRLLLLMTAAAVLFSVLFYLLYLPYARAAADRFPNAEELAGFFGLFWAAGTAAAFVVSMLATNRLFAWFGVAAMVVALPFVYATAFGVLLVGSGFVILVALRFVIGVWLQGVAQPGWEALTNVVPEQRRDQTRAFLNGGPMQLGTMIAGGLAIIGEGLSLRWLAVIGVVAAIVTALITVGIRRSYTGALVDALHAGRPEVFERGAIRQVVARVASDADAVAALAASLPSGDVRIRRLAYQLLAEVPIDARPPQLMTGLADADPLVRLAAVRAVDVSTSPGLAAIVAMIEDRDTAVAAAAAARTLDLTSDPRPASRLRGLLTDPDDLTRRAAVGQLALAPDDWAAELASAALHDPAPPVRAAALDHLSYAPDHSLAAALVGLRDPDPGVRVVAGRALARASGRHIDDVLAALSDRVTADAAVEALRCIELDGDRDRVRAFVRSAAVHATRDRQIAAAVVPSDDAAALLRDALLERGRRVALAGLWAATTLANRRAEMQTALDHLDGEPTLVANALEALDAAGDPRLVRPLLALWEQAPPSTNDDNWLSITVDDQDEFIRHCAELVRARSEGGAMPEPLTSLSILERVLFLRRVPLLADLAPSDLEVVAELADECAYADGQIIAAEGELGEELHIVVEGTIRVVRDIDSSAQELARRTTGDVAGEMSIITREPRIASLVADSAVRTIRLGHREFMSILRERPDVALAVMRVLANRLSERDAEKQAVLAR